MLTDGGSVITIVIESKQPLLSVIFNEYIPELKLLIS